MIHNLLEKYKKMPLILKGAFWFTLSSFFQKGISVITTPIFTRLMSKSDFGVYQLYVSWLNILVVLCTFNLSLGLLNSILVRNIEKKNDVITAVTGFEFFCTFFVFSGYLIYSALGGPTPGLSKEMGFLLFIQIISDIPLSVWLVLKKFDYSYKATIVVFLKSIVATACSVGFIFLGQNKALLRIEGYIVASMIFMIFILFNMFRRSKKIFDKNVWKICFFVGGPLVFHFLSESIMGQTDRLIIDYYQGTEITAVYSVAHSISWLLYIFVTSFNSILIPWMFKKIKVNDLSNISLSVMIIYIMLSTLVVIVSLFSPELMWLFGGEGYLDGQNMIPPLASSLLFIYMTSILTNFEFYYQKTIYSALATFLGATINVGLNFLFIPKFGAISACYTTLVSYAIIHFIHIIISNIVIKKNSNFKLKSFYNFRIMLLISLIYISLIFGSQLLFDFLWLRIILIIILIVILLLLRKKISAFINLLKSKHEIDIDERGD